jgi:hypothetical protein
VNDIDWEKIFRNIKYSGLMRLNDTRMINNMFVVLNRREKRIDEILIILPEYSRECIYVNIEGNCASIHLFFRCYFLLYFRFVSFRFAKSNFSPCHVKISLTQQQKNFNNFLLKHLVNENFWLKFLFSWYK